MTDLTLVLACYQEGPELVGSLARILRTVRRLGAATEIVAVDDGSTDRTAEVLAQLEGRPEVRARIIRHRRNLGRGASVREGLAVSEGAVVGFLDPDLEVGAKYIPVFLDAIRDGADVAIARRVYSVGLRGVPRYILSRGYNRLVRARLGLPYSDTEAGFKFFAGDVARALAGETADPGWFWDTEVVAVAHRKGFEIAEIPVLFTRRRDKRSTVRPLRDSVAYYRSLRRFAES